MLHWHPSMTWIYLFKYRGAGQYQHQDAPGALHLAPREADIFNIHVFNKKFQIDNSIFLKDALLPTFITIRLVYFIDRELTFTF